MTSAELLEVGARQLGINLSEVQVQAFLLYFAELAKWNRHISLTAIRDERDMVIKHGLDSLAYAKGFTARSGMRLLDMGSGPGFPALPLKIMLPDLTVTLVESVGKKASFLRHIIRTLRLDSVSVLQMRTNQAPGSHCARYDIVTARAFATMEHALEEGMRFLAEDGCMVLSRGPEEALAPETLVRASVVIKDRIPFSLPFSNHPRMLWVFARMLPPA